jgi:hypothetical protein
MLKNLAMILLHWCAQQEGAKPPRRCRAATVVIPDVG